MEEGIYTQDGFVEKDTFSDRDNPSQPVRFTIQCDSGRLEIVNHAVLYVRPESWATVAYASAVVGIGLLVFSWS